LNRIKEIREEKHITQAELAEQVGLNRSMISYIESGRKTLSIKIASEIADFLNVTLDELAGRERKEK